MEITFIIEVIILCITVLIWGFSIKKLKKIPKGLIEWLLLLFSIGVVIAWLLRITSDWLI